MERTRRGWQQGQELMMADRTATAWLWIIGDVALSPLFNTISPSKRLLFLKLVNFSDNPIHRGFNCRPEHRCLSSNRVSTGIRSTAILRLSCKMRTGLSNVSTILSIDDSSIDKVARSVTSNSKDFTIRLSGLPLACRNGVYKLKAQFDCRDWLIEG